MTAFAAISAFPPELLEPIVRELEPLDLYNCTITNRDWYQAFNTYLWQNITLKVPTTKNLSYVPLHKFRTAVEGGALVNRGHMVETLSVGYYEVLELLDSDAAVVTAEHGDNDSSNDPKTDNDSDKVNKEDDTGKQKAQSTDAYKPVCTNLRRLHVGSGPDPACLTPTNFSPYTIIAAYSGATITRYETSSPPQVANWRTPIINFTPSTFPRSTNTAPNPPSTVEMVNFGGPVVFGAPDSVVSAVSLTSAPAPVSSTTPTPTTNFLATAPITSATTGSTASITSLFDAALAAGTPIPGFGSTTSSTSSSRFGTAPTAPASGSTTTAASVAPSTTTAPIPAFGSSITSTGLFGNTPSTATITTSFFGATSSSTTTSTFGAAPTTTTPIPTFGSTAASTSLVGAAPAATTTSAFGVTPSTTTTGLFGTPPTTDGLFSTAPTATTTGTATPSAAGSSFEANSTTSGLGTGPESRYRSSGLFETSSSLFSRTTSLSHASPGVGYAGFGHPDVHRATPASFIDTSNQLVDIMNKTKAQLLNQLLDHRIDLPFLVSLLRQNNQLRVLSLQGRLLDPFGAVFGDLADVFAALPASLESLRLNGFRGMSLLSDMKLSVEQLKTHGLLHRQFDRQLSRWPTSLPSPPPSLQMLPFLRTIRIVSCRFNINHLVPLFRRCPNLQALRLTSMDRQGLSARVSTALRDSCPRLNDLGLSGHLGYDEDISKMISASTCGWVTLSLATLAPYGFETRTVADDIHRKNFFERVSTQALLKHASTLENLYLDGAIGFHSRDIHKLLCSAPRLKRLQHMTNGRRNTYDARLESADLTDIFSFAPTQWVCQSLEYFACQINMPRPDLEQNAMVNPLLPGLGAAMERSYPIYRKIYSRFAQLTRLKVLIFGSGDSGSCLFGALGLPMSLESGLDLLANLKELEYVDCHQSTTKFWHYEVQHWAKANWPKYDRGSSVAKEFWRRGGYFDDGTDPVQDPLSDNFLFTADK
ncbi:hypothetical protein BGW39_008567 [Mortierella sp. 14UC]|nr:hypothetical protein BGW39_008567 [Mortierella sp. 14UC]